MYPKLKAIALAALLASLLAGCVTTWQPTVSTAVSAPKDAYAIRLPQGWIYRAFPDNHTLLATRDGLPLQDIVLQRRALAEPLPFSKAAVSKTSSLETLAEAMLAEAKSNPALKNVELAAIRPHKFGPADGSLIEITYSAQDGLLYRSATVAALKGDHLFTAKFNAPNRHYFQNDYDAFLQVVSSATIP